MSDLRAGPDDIVVMVSGAFAEAYLLLSREFAHATGHGFFTAATKMGSGSASIPSRLAAGERVDLVIVASSALDKLMDDGLVRRGSRTDLARSRIAMAVRAGAPAPDISTLDALKQSLLAAKSVACSHSVSGEYLIGELFPQLGLAEEMRSKTRMAQGESVAAVVARGDAEIGFQQVSELRNATGVRMVGVLPEGAQQVTVFSAGIGAKAKHVEAAEAFVLFLISTAARLAMMETGLELA
jgi:molybdate transport system substrate-binding protein